MPDIYKVQLPNDSTVYDIRDLSSVSDVKIVTPASGASQVEVTKRDEAGTKVNNNLPADLKITGEMDASKYTINGVNIFDKIYPVGAIYISWESTDPGTLFGGTWVAIGSRMLIGVSSIYPEHSTGGLANSKLYVSNLPPHRHMIAYQKTNPGTTETFTATDGTALVTDRATDKKKYYKSYTMLDGYQDSEDGTGKPFTNLPPYIAVYIWRRTA